MAAGSAVKLRSFTRPRTPCGLPISPTRMRLTWPARFTLRSSTPSRAPPVRRCGAPRSGAKAPIAQDPPIALSAGRGSSGRGALLRLLLRRGLLRLLAELRHRRQAGLAEELRHAVGGNRALADPVRHALVLQAHALGMLGGQHRVVAADLLDEAAVARAAAVGHHDVVVRTLLGTGAG